MRQICLSSYGRVDRDRRFVLSQLQMLRTSANWRIERPGESSRNTTAEHPCRRFELVQVFVYVKDQTAFGRVAGWKREHQVEFGDDLACLDQGWTPASIATTVRVSAFVSKSRPIVISARLFSPTESSEGFVCRFFRSSSAGRPLADDAERASEATRLQTAPKFSPLRELAATIINLSGILGTVRDEPEAQSIELATYPSGVGPYGTIIRLD